MLVTVLYSILLLVFIIFKGILFNGLGHTLPSFLHCFFGSGELYYVSAASKFYFIHCSSH